MRMGGFELYEPVPDCNETYAIATLRPWIDVGSVGSLVLNELEKRYEAVQLGALHKPGRFFDFTRYRPVIHLEDGIRELSTPNTKISYAKREGQNDLILLDMLEPHMNAEFYISSVMKLLEKFRTSKYILLGSMYDTVPHTRPLLVSGYGMGYNALKDVEKAGALPITYRGPSTIVNLVAKQAAESGIDSSVFIVSLPQYVALEEDYAGKVRIMEVLNTLYNVPIDKEDFDKALEQRTSVSDRIDSSPEVRMLLPQLESVYDLRIKAAEKEGTPHLTPEMEAILWKIAGKDVGKA